MTEIEQKELNLAPDLPLTDPSQDEFGYAPFAEHLAKTILRTPSQQGLVFAINGSWGSGKTSVANFVKYYLSQAPQKDKPIIVDFNPWWFGNKEQLAAQFISQFQVKLPHESVPLMAIGSMMAKYSDTIGLAVSYTTGVPFIDKIVGILLRFLKKEPKDVSELKSEISEKLKNARQKFVFVIDDIDRLTPEEVKEVFKVIKALADFPNVIYLLSFDHETVSRSLSASLSIDGGAYLEKIVQSPLSLPYVDKIRLRKKLFDELDKLLTFFAPNNFDNTYWGNIYHDGLDPYIKKPRDICRITNALKVTYPSVVGEVNNVDFIALEFLRVFEPSVYSRIRDNREYFAGTSRSNVLNDKNGEKNFHENWLGELKISEKQYIKNVLSRMFPRFGSVFGNSMYDGNWLPTWRKSMRVCSPEFFDIYFQFGLAPYALSCSELNKLLVVAESNLEQTYKIFFDAAAIKQPDGTSKAREIIERLTDLKEEIKKESAENIIHVLFRLDDGLLPKEDEKGWTGTPNVWRMFWLINSLLQRIPHEQHAEILLNNMSKGHAIELLVFTIMKIEEWKNEYKSDPEKPISRIDDATTTQMKNIIMGRLNDMKSDKLLIIQNLGFVIHHWKKWAGDIVVSNKIKPIIENDELLPSFIEKFLEFGRRHAMGDNVTVELSWLDPKRIEVFTDLSQLETRIQNMLTKKDITGQQRQAGEKYIEGMQKIKKGLDSSAPF